MGSHSSRPVRRTSRLGAVTTASAVAVALGVAMALGASGVAGAAVVPTVPLGTSAAYGVLGGSTVTNTGPSVITGLDVGVSPGTALTGFPPGIVTAPGTVHLGDAQALDAQGAALTAFDNAAGRDPAPADEGLTDLTGRTLQPGVYQGNLSLTGTVTLDNSTDPNAVFIFQASSTLITGTGSVVAFTTPHASCNVFWQVGSSATIAAGSAFVGTVLAQTSITAETGASVTGRLLAATGAVTLDTNVITAPNCAVAPPTTPTTPTSTSGTAGPVPPPGSSTPPSGPTGPVTTITPPNANTTPSTIPLLSTTPVTTADTFISPPNENTTPGTVPLLTSPSTTRTTTVGTVPLTQPSFPTGVPGGNGPPVPTSPISVIGAMLILLGSLFLMSRLPAARRLGARLHGSWTRSGGHR